MIFVFYNLRCFYKLRVDIYLCCIDIVQVPLYGQYVRPVCLPQANTSFPAGLECIITGWGAAFSGILVNE